MQYPDINIDNIGGTYVKPFKYEEESFSYWLGVVKQSEKSINIIWYVIFGLIFFVVISFATAVFIMLNDNIRNKDLYLKYNNLYESYFEENSNLKDKVVNQQIEINNLRHEIELLRTKNPYLK